MVLREGKETVVALLVELGGARQLFVELRAAGRCVISSPEDRGVREKELG